MAKSLIRETIHELNNFITEFSFSIQLLQYKDTKENQEVLEELQKSLAKMEQSVKKLESLDG